MTDGGGNLMMLDANLFSRKMKVECHRESRGFNCDAIDISGRTQVILHKRVPPAKAKG
jgi:hypothetical protein